MQLDWITVSAQIVNFLILVFLLKRFLYGPVIRAMDRREQRIAERIHQADAAVADAEWLKRRYEVNQKTLETEREQLILLARQDAEKQRTVMLEELRREIDERRALWAAQLKRDRELYLTDLTRMIGGEVMSIARRTLRDLADTGLEQNMIRSFIDGIEADAERFLGRIPSIESDWTIVTGFELSQADRDFVSERLRQLFSGRPAPRFRREPEMVCGIALESGGRRWAWSVDAYLKELEQKVSEALSQITVIDAKKSLGKERRA
ncbi:MAG: hypothetical protein ABFS02_04585 [Pseudomonadota bacterium]